MYVTICWNIINFQLYVILTNALAFGFLLYESLEEGNDQIQQLKSQMFCYIPPDVFFIIIIIGTIII